ncbi:MAG TPA: acyl-CoA thioesterase/bile acid-CoA:amino acid N-acyltransferase family protein [Actinomycetota bacterium]|jgi:dienelactone hydrolase|nr:acyl-CoA thioesterase/bile acid-CoA:amino acid N-acyltransferase family protein [Actinomycetota bacterium]
MQTDTSPGTVVHVDPPVARVDEPFRLTASGLPPGEPVTIRAATRDGELREWASSATFLAGDDGTVDVSTAAPLSGTYSGVDPTGLLWSMQPVERGPRTFFVRRKAAPLRVRVTVDSGGRELASCEVDRTFGGECVVRRVVDGRGLAGDLFFPTAGGPHPGVMVVSSSDGGQLDHAASLLAAHGYAVLSLGYCGVEDRPAGLHHIDLEYFEQALEWMAVQPEVKGDRIIVVGLSRGGELALQLASMFPRIAGVVAGSPCGIRQAGIGKRNSDFTKPAWIYGGTALPYVPARFNLRRFFQFYSVFVFRRPLRLRPVFEGLLRKHDLVAAATIQVEGIKGPVLLISGTADELWPSERFAELVMARLREHEHPYPDEHVRYAGAGHFVCFPYALPSMAPMTRMSPVPVLTMDFGGTAEANAASARDSWPEILRFLAAVPP